MRDEIAAPMETDEGAAGLRGSRHHLDPGGAQSPNLQTSVDSDQSRDSERKISELKERIEGLVQGGIPAPAMAKMVLELVEKRVQLELQRHDMKQGRTSGDAPPIMQRIMDAIEGLTKRVANIESPANAPQARTWASIASSPSRQSAGSAWVARKVVPARHTRELVIRTKGSLPPQPPAEVVSKINTVLRCSDALATRRLPSGDVVVSFKNDASIHTQNTDWIRSVFGEQASVSKRTYAVLAKGIPRAIIERKAEEDIKKAVRTINEVEVARCKARVPKSSEAGYGSLLIEVESVAGAQSLCDRGVVIEAQIFNCEPYSGELQITQCFNCHAFGHLAKACTRKTRCGFCGEQSHAGGDRECPRRREGTPSCINCKGQHPAWDRRCRAALGERQRIKEAYAHRPRQFVVGGSDTSGTPPSSGSSVLAASRSESNRNETDEEGYTPVSPKKRKIAQRGRPRELSRPELGNRMIDEVFATARTQTSRQSIAPPSTPVAGDLETIADPEQIWG